VVNQDKGTLAGQAITELGKVKGMKPIDNVDGVALTREEADRLVSTTTRQDVVGVCQPASVLSYLESEEANGEAPPGWRRIENELALQRRRPEPVTT
jgi:hypothetical protein